MKQSTTLLLAIALSTIPAMAADSPKNTADAPMTLRLKTPAQFVLDKNEAAFYRIALPAEEVQIVLDVARKDGRQGNIQAQLSLLDADGDVIQNSGLSFNEIHYRYRKVAYLTLKRPGTVAFKVTNSNADPARFWLAVSKHSDGELVPFYGEMTSEAIALGDTRNGRLDQGADNFYSVFLRKGEYKASLEFANARKQNSNIQGGLAFLDGDGGNQARLIDLNEIDVSYRKGGVLEVKRDANFIFRVHNSGEHTMNYLLRLNPAGAN